MSIFLLSCLFLASAQTPITNIEFDEVEITASNIRRKEREEK
jgi:hypothetical protein